MPNTLIPFPAPRELRAFDVFDAVPDGHLVMPVLDQAHDPHLRFGEWAVIDPSDRAVQLGELYAMRQSSGPVIWAIHGEPEALRLRRAHPDDPCVYLRPTNPRRALTLAEADAGAPMFMGDGPLLARFLPSLLIGRVVGVWQPSRPERATLLRPVDLTSPDYRALATEVAP